MPLPANFWTTGWLEKICTPDFSGGIAITTVVGNDTTIDLTTPINTVYAIGGRLDSTEENVLPIDRSAGLFYGKEAGEPTEVLAFNFGFSQGCLPHSPLAPLLTTIFMQQRWYTPPFIGMQIKFGGDTDDGSAGARTTASRIYAKVATDRVATYDLFHWQPLTIIGTIAEVVGAMLMYLGADPDTDIDQDSFDEAYDEMVSYGDDIFDWPFVWFRAVEGESVGDSIRRIIDHYFSFLVVDLSGKIAIKSRVSGTPSTQPVTPATVIGDPKIELPLDRITNTADFSYGEWCCFNKNNVTGYDKSFQADPGRAYFTLVEDADSIALFGPRSWNKQTRKDMVDGKEVNVSAASFPYYYFSFQSSFVGSKLQSVDANRVSLITLKQGVIGLDYGAGDELTSVDVNSNSGGGGYFWCMSQQVDFNSLTVVSVIQEEDYLVSQP